jgi:hypothetical protein
MAGRFEFRSPGADAGEAIRAELMRREALQRQAMLDEITRNREVRLKQHDDASLKLTEENIESQKALRASTIAQRDRENAEALTKVLKPKQSINSDTAAVLNKGLPGLVDEAPMTSPDPTPEMLRDPEQTPGVLFSPEVNRTYAGTAKQRDLESTLQDPNTPENVKNYLRTREAAGGEAIPYQLFEDQSTPVVLKRKDSSLHLFGDGKWNPLTGDVPKNARIVNETDEDGNGRSFMIPVTTGQGIYVINGRTGAIVSRFDTKPGEGDKDALTGYRSVLYDLGEIERTFDPAKVGPLMGRYKTIEQAFLGGDPVFNELQQSTQRLHNTIVYLRTGKQMNENEADRILAELVNVKLPPDVYLQRLQGIKNYIAKEYAGRAKLAYSRTTDKEVTDMVTPPADNTNQTGETPEQRKARLRKAAGLP